MTRLLALFVCLLAVATAWAETITDAQLPADTRIFLRLRLNELLKADAELVNSVPLQLPISLHKIGTITLAATHEQDAVLFIETPEAPQLIAALRADASFTTVTYKTLEIHHILSKDEDITALFTQKAGTGAGTGAGNGAKPGVAVAKGIPDDPGFGVEEEDEPDAAGKHTPHPVYFTTARPGLLLIADNLAVMTRQLDTLDGARPSLAQNKTPAIRVPADSKSVFHALIGSGLSELKEAGIDRMSVVMNLSHQYVEIRAEIVALSDEAAQTLRAMIEGGRMMALAAMGKAKFRERDGIEGLLNSLKVEINGRTLAVTMDYMQ